LLLLLKMMVANYKGLVYRVLTLNNSQRVGVATATSPARHDHNVIALSAKALKNRKVKSILNSRFHVLNPRVAAHKAHRLRVRD
jgi:hypothetical protein